MAEEPLRRWRAPFPEGFKYYEHKPMMLKGVQEMVLVLATDYEALRKRCEAVEFELDCLRAQYEERTAYTIVHRGAALCCSSAMRDAYSDEHHRAERLASALNAPQSGNPCIECGADHGQPCTCPQGDQAIAAAQEPSHG